MGNTENVKIVPSFAPTASVTLMVMFGTIARTGYPLRVAFPKERPSSPLSFFSRSKDTGQNSSGIRGGPEIHPQGHLVVPAIPAPAAIGGDLVERPRGD